MRDIDLVELLEARAALWPDEPAFTFLDRHADELAAFSYRELRNTCCALAAEMQQSLSPGDSVVLALSSGPRTVLTFLGCLCAGVLPVITTPPRHPKDEARHRRLEHVLRETRARRLYLSSEASAFVQDGTLPPDCLRLDVDEERNFASHSDAEMWRRPAITGDSPAYLQFTSGSTGKPKGILLSHANVLANLTAIQRVFAHGRDFRGFSWLPLHHDMGLVGHVFAPLHAGGISVLAPPTLFSSRPLAWLECISRFRATDSGAPPFAYHLCAARAEELTAELDLSCWRNAYCGAEVVDPSILERFAKRFAPQGFRKGALLPCYGLAEVTLLAAGGHELEQENGQYGYALLPEVGVLVLQPDADTAMPDGEPGEVCVSGPCVGKLLGDEAETRLARLGVDSVERQWLRTGDIGSVSRNRLLLKGRKDGMMIVRGVKHYPEDIETIATAMPELAGEGSSICFAVPGIGTSETVLLQEIRHTRPEDYSRLANRIHLAVAEASGLTLSTIALVRRGAILHTSSGKRARAATRDAWMEGRIRSQFLLRQSTGSAEARERSRDVAVIGMACRFPKAASLEEFWDLLAHGVDAIDEVPADRWDWKEHYAPEVLPGKMNTRWGGFLEGIYDFDARFFGIPDHEALEMDPHQRLVLEVAWRALEHAGLSLDRLRGSNTGVFLGISTTDYLHLQIKARPDLKEFNAWSSLGSAHSVAANRLSYVFDLHGPSFAVDTACSSSLTAMDAAIRSLRNGDCDLAIAGGVNVILSPGTTVALSQFHMMADDGRCKVFDESANGYVRSEGCGLVVLQRAEDAIADKTRVLAWVRGSALTQDGRTRGITSPNPEAQGLAIEKALRDAGCSAEEITLIEAHGTGTAAGDPAEVNELRRRYGSSASSLPCAVGSVKANIGHLESAAGVAGFIKMVLALQRGEIVPQIHVHRLHRDIALDGSRLEIPLDRRKWERPAFGGRLAALSSFGFGGANAHMILEESEPQTSQQPIGGGQAPQLFVLSAATERALQDLAGSWTAFLGKDRASLPVLARAQAAQRSHFAHRAAFVAHTSDELGKELAAFGQMFPRTRPRASVEGGIAFLFGGHGSHYRMMGKELSAAFPVFRETLVHCWSAFASWNASEDSPQASSAFSGVLEDGDALEDPVLQAVGIFAFEYALCQTFQDLGIAPAAVMGHSLGEYTAACVAGCMTMEDTIRLVAARAGLIASIERAGAMTAVMASEVHVREVLDREGVQKVSIAAENAPEVVTISGGVESLARAEEVLQARAIATRRLRTLQAFHSELLDEILPRFEEIAAGIIYQAPRIPLVSNLTGEVRKFAPDAAYWRRHLREAVRFRNGVETLRRLGVQVFLEAGPGHALSNFVQRCAPQAIAVSSATEVKGEVVSVLRAMGRLYTLGADLAWPHVYRDIPTQAVDDLPGHPLYRKRYYFADGLPGDADETSEESLAPVETALPAGYQVEWVAANTTAEDPVSTEERKDEVWILLGGKLADELALHLPRDKRSVFQIAFTPGAGSRYRKTVDRATGATRFLVAPGCSVEIYAEIFQEIVSRLARADGARWNVVCLNAMEAAHETTVGSLERDQDVHIVGDLLAVVQALLRIVAVKRLWLVTENAQPVIPAESTVRTSPLHLAQSPLWGFAYTVFLEHPDMRGALIDLPADTMLPAQARMVLGAVSAEDGEPLVAYRGATRYVPRLTRAALPPEQPIVFRKDGAYVITGGLGGLALQTALWMAERGAGKIVLAGRRGLPDRVRWPDIALNTEEGRRIDAVRRIEARGTEVEIRAVDITDHASVATMMREVRGGAKALRGIVHAAGVNWFAKVAEMERARTLETLKIKISAAWNLHELSLGAELDFFLLYSSVSSLWGSVSLAHYTAANGFLDALAHYRRSRGLPALSINWGPWSEAGMSSGYEETSVLSRLGFQLMSPERALRGMERVMAGAAPQWIVADINWKIFQTVVNFSFSPVFFSNVSAESSPSLGAHGGRLAAAQIRALPEEEARQQLIASVKRMLASVLLLEPGREFDIRQRFNLMGMDSLAAVAFAIRVETFAGIRMPTTLAWNFPTVQDVANHLYDLLSEASADVESAIAPPLLTPPTPTPIPETLTTGPGAWLRGLDPAAEEGRLRLICLPYAGAGASVYRNWPAQLNDLCEVLAVQLPGREERMDEPADTDLQRVAAHIADALQTLPAERFVLFGHSMGGLLAFQLARELRARGAAMPEALVLSACPAPGSMKDRERIQTLPDDAFRQRVAKAFDVPAATQADASVWKSLLPVLRSDITLMENYAPADESPLDVPLVVLGARSDAGLDRNHLAAWNTHTNADFALRMLAGGHMFVQDRAFLQLLREELQRLIVTHPEPASAPDPVFVS